MGRRERAQAKVKAGARRRDDSRQEAVQRAWHTGKLTSTELNLLGYHRNWRGKRVPN
jgi:hypothetical protein